MRSLLQYKANIFNKKFSPTIQLVPYLVKCFANFRSSFPKTNYKKCGNSIKAENVYVIMARKFQGCVKEKGEFLCPVHISSP